MDKKQGKPRKIPVSEHIIIKGLASQFTPSEISRKYNVDRRTIVYILYPERRPEVNWRLYYKKESHLARVKKYRAKLKRLA